MHDVFISGGTGYMGRAIIPVLAARGHRVRVLVRPGSERKLPLGCEPVLGSALDGATFRDALPPADTLVHLVGVAHPAPWKEHAFRAIDLTSLRASVLAAQGGSVKNFVYVSVAHPAPAMKAYIRVREECESILAAAAIPATILRPWYVLGPGHRWPVVLQPFYRLFERLPSTRESAMRLGLVTLAQMAAALVWAVENPPNETHILDVPAIRRLG